MVVTEFCINILFDDLIFSQLFGEKLCMVQKPLVLRALHNGKNDIVFIF